LRQQQQKFVATIAKRKIDQPAVRLQRISDFPQQARTHQMACVSFTLFEVIEIDENQRKIRSYIVANGKFPFPE